MAEIRLEEHNGSLLSPRHTKVEMRLIIMYHTTYFRVSAIAELCGPIAAGQSYTMVAHANSAICFALSHEPIKFVGPLGRHVRVTACESPGNAEPCIGDFHCVF